MFFFYIILIITFFLILIIKYLTIEIHLQNIRITIKEKNGKKLNKDYKIKIQLYLFEKIKLFKIDITKLKMEKLKLKKRFYNLEKKMIREPKKMDIKLLKAIKYLKPKIKKANLKIDIGLEDAGASAICVGFLSTIIGIFFKNIAQKNTQNFWKITPIYQNTNLLNINLDCIFSLKLIHIINTIYFIIKKGEKYVRTSNRGAYVNSNE